MHESRDVAAPPESVDSIYRTLVEQVRDYAIFLLDQKGWVRSWNHGVERVFGYPRQTFLTLHGSALFTPEDIAAGVPQRELETARLHGEANDDRWMARQDGSRFWANGMTTALRDAAGRFVGFAKVVPVRPDQKGT